MGNDTESNVFSPDVLGKCIVLMGPWYGGVDRLTVHFQPSAHPPKAFLENGHDASVMGRADIHQQIATAAVRTHDTIGLRIRYLYCSKMLQKTELISSPKPQLLDNIKSDYISKLVSKSMDGL